MPTNRVDVSALGLQPVGLTKLPHDLLRRVPFHLSHLQALLGNRDSHHGRTNLSPLGDVPNLGNESLSRLRDSSETFSERAPRLVGYGPASGWELVNSQDR
jgi:hypothetical protein